jgi:uncharacterized protein involved in exopolysaccharide biosynthesis
MKEQHPYSATAAPAEDEIDLRELLGVLWAEKWLIVACTSIAILASVIYALTATEHFRAEAVLMAAETRQASNPLLSQLGGAAALIGINVGSQNGGDVNNAIAVLQSREFISEFIANHNVLVPLFAGTWDRDNGTGIDVEIFDPTLGEWLQEGGAPSQLEAYRAFMDTLSVTRETNTGIVRVAVEWIDPETAANWANLLVQDINRDFKQADVREATDAIAYLQDQLQSTQLVEMQRVFYQLIESQTQVTMLADVREEYVFQVIDRAVAPDLRVSPQRTLIVLMGTFIGGFLAVVFVLVRRYAIRR